MAICDSVKFQSYTGYIHLPEATETTDRFKGGNSFFRQRPYVRLSNAAQQSFWSTPR